IRIDMQAASGTLYPMFGEVRELLAPERIVFTSGPLDANGERVFEVLNTLTLSETEGGTLLRLTGQILWKTAEAEQYLAGMQQGWTESLERLNAFAVTLHRGGQSGHGF